MWRSTFTELVLGTFLTLVLTGILTEQSRGILPSAPYYSSALQNTLAMVTTTSSSSPIADCAYSLWPSCGGSCPGGATCTSSFACNPANPAECTALCICTGGMSTSPPSCMPPNCDDGNACTADMCTSGGCSHTAVADCCRGDADCASNDPCWQTSCVANRCFGMYNNACCNDGNACTSDYADSGGGCHHDPIAGCGSSSFSSAPLCPNGCFDADVCTTDVCTSGGCTHQPIADCCNDDGDCASDDPCWLTSCISNQCFGMYDDACCDDGNNCTSDYADSGGGCHHDPIPGCGSSSSRPGSSSPASSSSSSAPSQQQCMDQHHAPSCPAGGACLPVGSHPCSQNIPCCDSSGNFVQPSFGCCATAPCRSQSNTCTAPANSSSAPASSSIPAASSSRPASSSLASSSFYSSSSSEDLVSCCFSTYCSDDVPASLCDEFGEPAEDPVFGGGNALCESNPCGGGGASSSTPTASSSAGYSSSSQPVPSSSAASSSSQPGPSSSAASSSSSQPVPSSSAASSSSQPVPSSSAASSSSSQPVPSSSAASSSSQPGPSSSASSSSACADDDKKSCCYDDEQGKHHCENGVCPDECKRRGSSAYPIDGACPTVPLFSFQWFTAWLLGATSGPEVKSCPVPETACCRENCTMEEMDIYGNWQTITDRDHPGQDKIFKKCVPNESAEQCSRLAYYPSAQENPSPKRGDRRYRCASGGKPQNNKSNQLCKTCDSTPPPDIDCCTSKNGKPTTSKATASACSAQGGFTVTESAPCKNELCCVDPTNTEEGKRTKTVLFGACSSPGRVVPSVSECKSEKDCSKISDGKGGSYGGCTWAQSAGQCSSSQTAKDIAPNTGVCCCPSKQDCCRQVSKGSQTNWTCTYEVSTLCGMDSREGDTYYHRGALLDSCSASEGGNCTNTKMEAGCCCNLKTGTFAGTTSMWLSFPLWGGLEKQSPQQLCTEKYKGGFTKASGMGGKSCDNAYCEGEQIIACCPPKPASIATPWTCTTVKKSEKDTKCMKDPPKEFPGSMCPTGDAARCGEQEKPVPCCYKTEDTEARRWDCNDATPTECKKRIRNMQLAAACPTDYTKLKEACEGPEDKVHCCERPSESVAWTCSLKKVSECNDPKNNISLGKATSDTCSTDELAKCTKPEDTIACCPLQANESGKWDCIDVKKSEESAKCQKGTTFGQLKCASINPPPTCYKPPERTVACCSKESPHTCWQLSLQEGQTCDTKSNPGLGITYYPGVYDPPSTCKANCPQAVYCCSSDKKNPSCSTKSGECGAGETQIAGAASCPAPGSEEMKQKCGLPDVFCCGTDKKNPTCSKELGSCQANKTQLSGVSACPTGKELKQKCGEQVYCCGTDKKNPTCTPRQGECDGNETQVPNVSACPTGEDLKEKCGEQVYCCGTDKKNPTCSPKSTCGDDETQLPNATVCPTGEALQKACGDKKVPCCYKSGGDQWLCIEADSESLCKTYSEGKPVSACPADPASDEARKKVCGDGEKPVACCPKEGSECKEGLLKEACDDTKTISDANSCSGIKCVEEKWCCYQVQGAAADSCNQQPSATTECPWKQYGAPYAELYQSKEACETPCVKKETPCCVKEGDKWACKNVKLADCPQAQKVDECPTEQTAIDEKCGAPKKVACCQKNALIDNQYDCPEKQGSCPEGSTEMDMDTCNEKGCPEEKKKTACCTLPPAENGGGSTEATECKAVATQDECNGLKGTLKGNPSTSPCSPNPCEPKMVPCCQKTGTTWICGDLSEENCKDPNRKVAACPAKPEDCGQVACCKKNPDGSLTGDCGLGTSCNTSNEQPAPSADGSVVLSCSANTCPTTDVFCCGADKQKPSCSKKKGSCGKDETKLENATDCPAEGSDDLKQKCGVQEKGACCVMGANDNPITPELSQCNPEQTLAQCKEGKIEGEYRFLPNQSCSPNNPCAKKEDKVACCTLHPGTPDLFDGKSYYSCDEKSTTAAHPSLSTLRADATTSEGGGEFCTAGDKQACIAAGCKVGPIDGHPSGGDESSAAGGSTASESSDQPSSAAGASSVGEGASSSEAPETGNCCIEGDDFGLCFADIDQATCEDGVIGGSFMGGSQCIESPSAGANCGPTDEGGSSSGGITSSGSSSSEGQSSSGSSTSTSCGNGTVEEGEECDEGSNNSNNPNAPCRTDCKKTRCGDGIVDDTPAGRSPEKCDLGTANGTQGADCTAACVHPCSIQIECKDTCTDGGLGFTTAPGADGVVRICISRSAAEQLPGFMTVVEKHERIHGQQFCDWIADGGDPEQMFKTRDNCCRFEREAYQDSCTSFAAMGLLGQVGVTTNTCTAALQNMSCTAYGSTACSPEGTMATSLWQSLQDSPQARNGQNSVCPVSGRCGDGRVDSAQGEECDTGTNNSNNPNAPCRTDCKKARCGDGIKDDNPSGRDKEACDDGDDCTSGHVCNSDTGTATCKTTCKNRNTFFTIGQWLKSLQLYSVNGTPVPNAPPTNEQTKYIVIGILTFILQ